MELFLALLPTIAVAGVLTLLEALRAPARTEWRINLLAWAIYLAVALTVQPLFVIAGIPSLLDGAALPFWLGLAIFVLVMDLGEFLFHRAQHAVPALWAMHSLHHSDSEMSALTTQRHFWGDQLLKTVTIWSAATLVIAPTPAMAGLYAALGLWHFVSHSRLPIDLGRCSWLINTPAYHRRHHSRRPEHFDSNFAGLFPIFDVICGTYHRPEGFPPTGLDHAPRNLRELAIWPLVHRGDAGAQTPLDIPAKAGTHLPNVPLGLAAGDGSPPSRG